jgi:putative signal transducing protein
MSDCPICKKKYSQGVNYCTECRVRVDQEFNDPSKEMTFVEVYRTEDVALAGLIKEVLSDHEVMCYLGNYFIAHIYSPYFSPIKVMVYKEDIENAEEIINLFFRED